MHTPARRRSFEAVSAGRVYLRRKPGQPNDPLLGRKIYQYLVFGGDGVGRA